MHQLLEHAVETYLRGIGDIAPKGVVKIISGSFEQGRDQRTAELFALPVDVGVVGSGKIDPLKYTTAARRRIKTIFDLDLAVAPHDDRFAGGQLHDFGGGAVECRLDRRPFTGDDKNFVIEVEIAGADRIGVADRKGVAGAVYSAEGKSSVESAERLSQHFLPVGRTGVEIGILLRVVRDRLGDDVAVGAARRVMSARDETVEKRTGIGQIEIARDQHRPAQAIGFVDKGVTGTDLVTTVSGVTQVPQE